MKNNFYIYRHIRLDTNTPFYVGKGRGKRAYYIKSRNKYWHKIVNKYGYEVEIMLDNLTEDEAFTKEIEFIKLYKTLGFCESNLTDGGEGVSGLTAWNRGFTKETNNIVFQCSKKQKGKKRSDEEKRNNSIAQKLKYINGYINPRKGKKCTEKTKKKMSLAKRGKTSNNKDKKISDESKLKMSLAKKGKTLSKEHKQKISKSLKGRKHTEEFKEKISKFHKNRIKTKEHKQKISDSLKEKYDNGYINGRKLKRIFRDLYIENLAG